MTAFIDAVVAIIGVASFLVTLVAISDAGFNMIAAVFGKEDNGIYRSIRTLDRGLTRNQAKRKLAIMTVLPAVLFMAASIYSGNADFINTSAFSVVFLSVSFFVSVKRYA